MTIIFENDITEESITHLINQIESSQMLDDNEINIYFSSEGGCLSYTNLFIDYINNSKKIITLIAFGEVTSGGFSIFYHSECNKVILQEAFAGLHTRQVKLNVTQSVFDRTFDSFMDKVQKKRIKEVDLPFFKELLTAKEYKVVANGNDLYIDSTRLRELIN